MLMENNPYQNDAALERSLRHLQRYKWYRKEEYLLYSAFDARLCIEQTLFVYLVLIMDFELSKSLEKLYRAEDLKKTILHHEPLFIKKIEFFSMFTKHLPGGRAVGIPDLDLISKSYGLINNYLHSQKRPEKTWGVPSWWQELEHSLEIALTHLSAICRGSMGTIRLNESGQLLFDQFVSGKITASEVQETLDAALSRKPMTRATE